MHSGVPHFPIFYVGDACPGTHRTTLPGRLPLLFYITGKTATIGDGVQRTRSVIADHSTYDLLERWVTVQNRFPEQGLARLRSLN